MSAHARTANTPVAKPGLLARLRRLLSAGRTRTAIDELDRAHQHRRNTL